MFDMKLLCAKLNFNFAPKRQPISSSDNFRSFLGGGEGFPNGVGVENFLLKPILE